MAVSYWFVSPSARPDFFIACERAFHFQADLAKSCTAFPRNDLAIRQDNCREVLAREGYFPNRRESCKEDITGILVRLSQGGQAKPRDRTGRATARTGRSRPPGGSRHRSVFRQRPS